MPLFKNRSTTALLHPTAPRLLGLQVASVAKGRTAAFPCCCPLCTRCLCPAASALVMAQGWSLNKEEEKKKRKKLETVLDSTSAFHFHLGAEGPALGVLCLTEWPWGHQSWGLSLPLGPTELGLGF